MPRKINENARLFKPGVLSDAPSRVRSEDGDREGEVTLTFPGTVRRNSRLRFRW